MTLFFVILNVLILLNVVIAMMADTYAVMTSVRRGLYNYNILQVTAGYKPDAYYGGLMVLPPPMCVLSFLLLPFYIFIRDRATLRSFNLGVYKGFYGIGLVVYGAIFLAINLILTPFAYLKTCAHKIRLAVKGVISPIDGLVYIVVGLLSLLLT